MEQALDRLVRILLAPTLATQNQWAEYDVTLRQFKRVIDRRGSPLDIDEAQFRELFGQYSFEVGNLIGSDKEVELVIARSWEEWVDQHIQKFGREYPEIQKPFLPLVKAAALNQLSPQSLESFLDQDKTEVLGFIQTHLQPDMSFMFDMQGITFDQRVVVDLNSFNRQVYSVLYLDYQGKGSVNNAAIRTTRQYGNGFAKYLVAHEGVHGHTPEIGESKIPVVVRNRQFVSDLFRMIYELGDENEQIYIALGGQVDEKDTKEIYACAIFNYAINKFQEKMFDPNANPDEFEPLPEHVREFMASYRGAFANYVVTVVDESVAEFIAEQVLRDDADYKAFRQIHDKMEQIKSMNAATAGGFEANSRKAGLPLIRTLYSRFGIEMLDILKQRLPQSPEELKQPQLYIERSGIN